MNTAQSLLTGHVVLVGYGRVGRRIARMLTEQGIPYVVAEQNRELVEQLRAKQVPAVSGNAADPAVLIQAHIARAGMLVIATPETLHVRKMVEIARTPSIRRSKLCCAPTMTRRRRCCAGSNLAKSSWGNTNLRWAWQGTSLAASRDRPMNRWPGDAEQPAGVPQWPTG